jgi:hypothetical protein
MISASTIKMRSIASCRSLGGRLSKYALSPFPICESQTLKDSITSRQLKFALLVCASGLLTGCLSANYHTYVGAQQDWPISRGGFVNTDHAIPVYNGLPERPYRVLGAFTLPVGQAPVSPDHWAADVGHRHQADAVCLITSQTRRAGTLKTVDTFAWLDETTTYTTPVYRTTQTYIAIQFTKMP